LSRNRIKQQWEDREEFASPKRNWMLVGHNLTQIGVRRCVSREKFGDQPEGSLGGDALKGAGGTVLGIS